MSWVVLGEFWHGALRAGYRRPAVEAFLQIGIPLLDPAPVIPVYAGMCAKLQENPAVYRAIGQNDLWIAAAALQLEKPLLTRNRRHFGAVSGLRVVVLENEDST